MCALILVGRVRLFLLSLCEFFGAEDSNRVVFTLEKVNGMEWWKCVMVGDTEINTRKVDHYSSPAFFSCLRCAVT